MGADLTAVRPPPTSLVGHPGEVADEPLRIPGGVVIPRHELTVSFSPSGGPGGQHANKAATRVELTWDVRTAGGVGPGQRQRLLDRLGPVVRVVADDERSQSRNRAIAERRLVARVADALRVERTRRPTRPGRRARQRRLDDKRRRSETKAARRKPTLE